MDVNKLENILKWFENKNINPYTNRKIKENGRVYKNLMKEYNDYILNNINTINNILSPLQSIEDKDIISLNQIWEEIDGERKIVYENLDNLITYKDESNHIHTFEKESLMYLKEFNIMEHPITKVKIPEEIFNNINIKLPKNKKSNNDLALEITQILSYNSFFIDHNYFLELNDNQVLKMYYESYSFVSENLPYDKLQTLKTEFNSFQLNSAALKFKKNKLRYVLDSYYNLITFDDNVKLLASYIIIASLSIIIPEIKKLYPDFSFGF
jgi:hypothetical protein